MSRFLITLASLSPLLGCGEIPLDDTTEPQVTWVDRLAPSDRDQLEAILAFTQTQLEGLDLADPAGASAIQADRDELLEPLGFTPEPIGPLPEGGIELDPCIDAVDHLEAGLAFAADQLHSARMAVQQGDRLDGLMDAYRGSKATMSSAARTRRIVQNGATFEAPDKVKEAKRRAARSAERTVRFAALASNANLQAYSVLGIPASFAAHEQGELATAELIAAADAFALCAQAQVADAAK